jgi:hypothetical protein
MKTHTLEDSIAERVHDARNTFYLTMRQDVYDSRRFYAADHGPTPAEQRLLDFEKKQAWLKQLSKRRF